MAERRYLPAIVSAALALIALVVSLLLLSAGAGMLESRVAPAQGTTTRYVAPGGDCGGSSPCYASIQAAVDAADPDDVIRVAAGNYTDIHVRNSFTQVVYISKTVTIRGGYTAANGLAGPPDLDANPTTLDAQGRGRVVVIREGGPTIEDLIITGGVSDYSGGGIHAEYASPVIRRNRIVGNSAEGGGGAILVNGGSARILQNHIAGNTATWAGGLRIINDADATVGGNEIMSNVAQIAGGGIDLECCGGTTLLVARNIIVNNEGGGRGGGIVVDTTHARLVNNILAGNQASRGAGIWLDGMAGYPASANVVHNTLVGGPSGGEAVWVGEYVTATLVNNIIVSYTVGITSTAPASSTVTADHTLFDGNGADYGGGVSSTNEVGGDPAFVDPGKGDYHIDTGSAAVDRGTDAGVTIDLDGDRRPFGPLPDLGADEIGKWVFLPVVLKNLVNN